MFDSGTYLTAGLVLELIVLACVIVAEAALEDAATMLPHASLALYALGVAACTGAGVALQALPPVAHPCLATQRDLKQWVSQVFLCGPSVPSFKKLQVP